MYTITQAAIWRCNSKCILLKARLLVVLVQNSRAKEKVSTHFPSSQIKLFEILRLKLGRNVRSLIVDDCRGT